MASPDFLNVLTNLGVDNAQERTAANNLFSTVGTRPGDLLTHTDKKTILVTGVTPEEFMRKHGGPEFSFQELIEKFKTICTDYGQDLHFQTKSRAVEFCSKMIYEIGPMTRQVTKSGGDEVYKFIFIYSATDIRAAFVCTFKSSDPISDYNEGNKIVLTVKQAMLLAVKTLEQLNIIGSQQIPNPVHLLTPLAGAVFSKEDIPAIARKLNKAPQIVANIINASSQSGGQYMTASTLSCAAVCVIMSTKGLKDNDTKTSIICKTMRQYISKQKEFAIGEFEAFAEFAHGGIPEGLEPVNLMNMLSNVQERALTARKAAEAARQTAMIAETNVPEN